MFFMLVFTWGFLIVIQKSIAQILHQMLVIGLKRPTPELAMKTTSVVSVEPNSNPFSKSCGCRKIMAWILDVAVSGVCANNCVLPSSSFWTSSAPCPPSIVSGARLDRCRLVTTLPHLHLTCSCIVKPDPCCSAISHRSLFSYLLNKNFSLLWLCGLMM